MSIDRLHPTSPQLLGQYDVRPIELAQLLYIGSEEKDSQSSYTEGLQSLEATLWQERERTLSAPEQLRDPVRQGLIGTVIPSKEEDPTEKDALLMDRLSNTLISLTDFRNRADFVIWFTQKLNEPNPEQTLYLLQSLIHTACMLDIESYEQMMNIKEDIVSLLPLDTLGTCISVAKERDVVHANDITDRAFTLLNAQYQKLLETNIEKREIKQTELEDLYPDATELGHALLPWVNQQVANGSIPLEKGLQAMLNYLEMHNAQKIEDFIQSLLCIDGKAMDNLKMRAIEDQLIEANDEEKRQVIFDGLQETMNRELVDGLEVNHRERIGVDVETVWCAFETGAFGPFHRAHRRTAETIEELIQERQRMDKRFYGKFYIVPACSSRLHASVTSKPAEQIGALSKRIDSILLTTRHLPNTFVTTALGEEYATSGEHRMQIIHDGITNSIKEPYEDEPTPFNINIVRVSGTDKLWLYNESENKYILNTAIPDYKGPSIIKTRRRQLVLTLLNLQQIRDHDSQTTLILTPDSPKGSSSEALHKGDYTYFSIVALAIVNGYWDKKAISERMCLGYDEDEVFPVTIYGNDLKRRIQERLTA